MHPTWPPRAATWRGEALEVFWASLPRPDLRSSRTISSRPLAAATCRRVLPNCEEATRRRYPEMTRWSECRFVR